MTKLIDQLTNKNTKLTNNDAGWIIYINDHIDIIKSESTTVVIDDIIRDRYRFKFDHFLRDNTIRIDIAWIAKLINDLDTYDDFTLRTFVYLPDVTKIETMYRQYRTSIRQAV